MASRGESLGADVYGVRETVPRYAQPSDHDRIVAAAEVAAEGKERGEKVKDYYKFDEQHRPIPVTMLDYFDWQRSLPEDIRTGIGRKVAKSTFGHVVVSTVFLGTDHGFGSGPPVLYETMIFGGDRDEETHRYTTWDDATKGHERISAEIAKQIEEQTKNPIEA